MSRVNRIILLLIMVSIGLFLCASSAYAWLYYSKPEFYGRVIDKETKQPIEGAVVVVLYEKWESHGPGGGSAVPFDAKETLTDKNGDFHFPSYRTLIGPLSRQEDADFIIFKPGYRAISSIDGIEGMRISKEKYFTIDKGMVGKEGEIKYIDEWETLYRYQGPLGIVQLKWGEFAPAPPTDFRSDRLPLLYKAINEDRRNRGYKGEEK
jgi:hypothetical protein